MAQRASIKGRVTKFKNYLKELESCDDISQLEANKLALKLSKFEALFIEFDELQGRIEILNANEQDGELNIRDLIEQDFYHCIATAQNIERTTSPLQTSQPPSEAQANSTISCQHEDTLSFKLPVIKIPNFDGTYFKWLEFKETFTSLVHENPKIKAIHKFYYLNSYLEGEAARVVCGLEVSEHTYADAWHLLCERFDNKRQLINNHLKSLFNIESVRETDKSLRFIIDHVTKNLRALSTLGLPTDKWDILVIYIISAKLDQATLFKWEEHRNGLPEIPTLDNFFNFLKNRADVFEIVNRNRQPKQPFVPQTQQKSQTKTMFVASKVPAQSQASHKPKPKTIQCLDCQGSHRLYQCPTFKAKSVEERNKLATSLNVCQNCLRVGHEATHCKLPGSCRSCKKRHNSLLHQTEEVTAAPNAPQALVMSVVSSPEVLLCTAMVQLVNPTTNETISVRAMLDCGSQSSFITEDAKHRLHLAPQPSIESVVCLGGTPLTSHVERCSVQLQSADGSFGVMLSCLVIPNISDNIPKAPYDLTQFDLSRFQMADPKCNEPAPVDMLIGSNVFWSILGDQRHSLGADQLSLRSSKLGWLMVRHLPDNYAEPIADKPVFCNFVTIDQQLTRFWELESFPEGKVPTTEDEFCEKHYVANTTRNAEGRFCVGLPLRRDRDSLGESYHLAKKRFTNLEARFKKQPQLKEDYVAFINEYSKLGHLSELPPPLPTNAYVLPHHPVIKETSESTKLRVVFDASARTTTGLSVNDLQYAGPILQDSLFDILIRFRQHRYVFSGDIEKMFRQVLLKDSDRHLQIILWRENESDPIRTLQLNTVTYGFTSASFLTTRCIRQLGEECLNPHTKEVIQKDFYVDDLLTGADTVEELRHLQRSVSDELAKGCFHLRKYRSNLPDLLSNDINLEEGELMISNATSTLGIGWAPSSDQLHFQIHDVSTAKAFTKRSILSSTFKIFDPLGLLSLCTIKPKILLQKLWIEKLDWDEPVPQDIMSPWLTFVQQMPTLATLTLPRRVLVDNPTSIEMHCFSDASQKAYGTCVFLRSTNADGEVESHLLCAKTKVAPLTPTTIPRLELCAALLGAQLSSTVTKALRCPIDRHVYWTDSSIVLCWLKSEAQTKTFVANRIAKILKLAPADLWRHVPTSHNPADHASRGVDPQHAGQLDLWWHGPNFLLQPETCWPNTEFKKVDHLPEIKAFPALVAEAATSSPLIDTELFSNINRPIRILAWVIRFTKNCKNPPNKQTGPLKSDELSGSLNILIKMAQKDTFQLEIDTLKNGKPLKPKSLLLSLNPFLDADGILRVGGRIGVSMYPYEKKHPIVLKSTSHLTKLLFQQEHNRLFHAGPSQLLASIRERYWPIGGRTLARQVTRHCVVCCRFKGQTQPNLMGNLPAERVEPDFPFSTVGTDYAGPFLITDRKGRGCKITKCYLCIFICFRYKCVHLELVSELSKDAYIITLKRFIARRGIPKIICSDNGGNFVAAAKEISTFLQTNRDSICDFAAHQGIEFRFAPPYAPHFNGLAEAGVKSAKHLMYKMLGNTHLTFEELSTLFTQIEAILNSRPLCPLSPSPTDLQSLTPGHFLIGRPLTALPSTYVLDTNANRLNRYQRLEQCRQHFWKRWAAEYVGELQQRTKWRTRCRDLQTNDMVLIKEDAPPLCWRLGRISKVYPGADGIPRVADVITSNQGAPTRRAINRLCVLPTTSHWPAPEDVDADS